MTVVRSVDVVSPGGRGRRSLRACTRVLGEGGVPLELAVTAPVVAMALAA